MNLTNISNPLNPLNPLHPIDFYNLQYGQEQPESEPLKNDKDYDHFILPFLIGLFLFVIGLHKLTKIKI